MNIRARLGDTLTMYSEWFSVPYELIVDANLHLTGKQLQQGDVVIIPGYETIDTLENLARFTSVHVEALKRMNGAAFTNGQFQIPKRIDTPIVNGKRQYDFAALQQDIECLCDHYPFIRKRVIGSSVLGLPLIELKIGQGSTHIHINGSFHANEWITTAIIMTFVNDYLLALTNGRPLRGHRMLDYYKKVTLSIVPMVNPDGVNLVLNGPPEAESYRDEVIRINSGSLDFSQWKANIRGIDLNNQFPAKWEVEQARKIPKAPAPRDFPGVAPLTEPETKAMAALTNESDFAMILAFHTQGKEIYWGYEGFEPSEAEKTVNEFANVSGYKAIRYIDSHAGYRDWFIQTWRRQGYTIELGEGVNPLPIEQFSEIYKDSLGIFLAALYMA
ncbi:M14 family metallopeptidase [Thermaerobacillus caldiproteolyticus]|uniref:G-D-glutamyl-meso-diaminopimelate peptidase n=1 Tax=Thermaerobacillus caldiproteolyticus TaxID=247480 RepID=A0A7V9Z3T7_9BACL|nr:M14 family metallocarboxypeptidase [Anoxybacillus caldiproteolyticus]MBA2873470.1 g-D-glutamyl-meso-diaminopimelate peptidase [Anoxybacillus caldiproteolyticus]QPA30068.1 peptidase M14 [Anoxybacillus caldiproteolyticus]